MGTLTLQPSAAKPQIPLKFKIKIKLQRIVIFEVPKVFI